MKRVPLGMSTPSSNTALEPLNSAMVAGLPEVSLRAQALGQFDLAPIRQSARLLADARVDVVAWNGTSSGWPGFEADQALCERVTQETSTAAWKSLRLCGVDTRRVQGWGSLFTDLPGP